MSLGKREALPEIRNPAPPRKTFKYGSDCGSYGPLISRIIEIESQQPRPIILSRDGQPLKQNEVEGTPPIEIYQDSVIIATPHKNHWLDLLGRVTHNEKLNRLQLYDSLLVDKYTGNYVSRSEAPGYDYLNLSLASNTTLLIVDDNDSMCAFYHALRCRWGDSLRISCYVDDKESAKTLSWRELDILIVPYSKTHGGRDPLREGIPRPCDDDDDRLSYEELIHYCGLKTDLRNFHWKRTVWSHAASKRLKIHCKNRWVILDRETPEKLLFESSCSIADPNSQESGPLLDRLSVYAKVSMQLWDICNRQISNSLIYPQRPVWGLDGFDEICVTIPCDIYSENRSFSHKVITFRPHDHELVLQEPPLRSQTGEPFHTCVQYDILRKDLKEIRSTSDLWLRNVLSIMRSKLIRDIELFDLVQIRMLPLLGYIQNLLKPMAVYIRGVLWEAFLGDNRLIDTMLLKNALNNEAYKITAKEMGTYDVEIVKQCFHNHDVEEAHGWAKLPSCTYENIGIYSWCCCLPSEFFKIILPNESQQILSFFNTTADRDISELLETCKKLNALLQDPLLSESHSMGSSFKKLLMSMKSIAELIPQHFSVSNRDHGIIFLVLFFGQMHLETNVDNLFKYTPKSLDKKMANISKILDSDGPLLCSNEHCRDGRHDRFQIMPDDCVVALFECGHIGCHNTILGCSCVHCKRDQVLYVRLFQDEPSKLQPFFCREECDLNPYANTNQRQLLLDGTLIDDVNFCLRFGSLAWAIWEMMKLQKFPKKILVITGADERRSYKTSLSRLLEEIHPPDDIPYKLVTKKGSKFGRIDTESWLSQMIGDFSKNRGRCILVLAEYNFRGMCNKFAIESLGLVILGNINPKIILSSLEGCIYSSDDVPDNIIPVLSLNQDYGH